MNQTAAAPNNDKKSKISVLARVAIMTAVTCILSPMAVPIGGPVPISLATLALYLSLYLLGWKWATASYFVYLLIGMAGLPVFSGFSGGLGKLMGPTGGYIIGFLPMVIIAGLFVEHFQNRGLQFLGLVLGTAVCYLFGTVWYCFVADSAFVPALGLCVFPFIPGDLIKILAVMLIGPVIRNRLVEAGLMKNLA